MPTLTTTPATPVPGKPCKVRATATAGGSLIRLWCTDAPLGSALRKKLDDSGATRVAFDPPTVQAGKDFDFTPDKGGGYVLRLDELVFDKPDGINPNFGGAYEGDVRGAKFERIQTSTSTTLNVANEYRTKLGFGADTATLVVHAIGDEVVVLRKDVHGLISPRIELSGQPSSKARIASESAEVRHALTLFGRSDFDTATKIVGEPSEIIDSLIAALNRHLRGTENHAVSAADQVIGDEFLHPSSNVGMVASLAEIRRTLDRHIRNDDGNGTGSIGTHEGDGGMVDWASLPLVSPSESTIHATIADLNRCVDNHMRSSVHLEYPDFGTSTPLAVNLADRSVLLWTHELFLKQLAALSPTAPANANAIGAVLVGKGGFQESA